MHKRNKNKHEAVRIAQYLISGGAFFWSGYLVFFIADSWFGLSLWWAKLLANIVGWIVNYVLQRYWVFSSSALKKVRQQVTFRYVMITGVNFLLDFAIVWLLKKIGITPYIGQFLSAGFFTIWNYLWYKLWVFTEKQKG